MQQRITRPLAVLAAAFVAFTLASCSSSAEGDTSGSEVELVPLVLPVAANAGYAPWDVALEMGFFADHGLDVTLKTFDNGVAGTQAMIAGDVQAGGTVEMPLISNLAQGADIVVPAIWFTGEELRLVAAKEIESPQDLAGTSVGLQVGGINDYALQRYLEKYGVDASTVTIVNVAGADQVAALARGDVDAIVNEEPIVSTALGELGDAVHILSPSIGDVTTVRNYLQFDRAWAEENPDLVKAVLAALTDANAFIEEDPLGAAEVASKRVGVDAETLASWWADGEIRWTIYLDDASRDALAEVGQWMFDSGLVDTEVDTDAVFDTSYLEALDPAAVTLSE